MRTKAELDNMAAQSALLNNTPLLSKDAINFLAFIKAGSSILELNGGLGIVSEHLSATCPVKLCEDGRLFFTYRRKLFPKSSVTEMNISPHALSTSVKIVDYVIIHSSEFLEIAKKLAKKFVIVMYDFSVISTETKVENEKVDINSVTNNGSIPKNISNKEITAIIPTNSDFIHDDELPEPTGDGAVVDANSESVFDLE